MALAFDRGPSFAVNKRADEPCRHLLPVVHRCAIHARREERGFRGCVGYDCLGAGQRVTALFEGRSDATALEAFRRMQDVHRLLVLLQAARELPLGAERAARCEELFARVDGGELAIVEVHAFLRTLRDVILRASSAPG